MADPINPQELSDLIVTLNESLRAMTSSVSATQVEFDEFGSELNLSQKQQRARDNALHQAVKSRIDKEKEAAQKAADNWAKVSKASLGVASSMTSQEGAFNMLGNVTATVIKGIGNLAGSLPIIGNALKGLGEGAAEGVKLITEQTAKAFATFGKLSSTGVVTSFQDMKAAAERTGLMYAELDGVLTKNSESLALLGTTSTNGSKTLQTVLEMNKAAAIEAQKMGISFAEYSEMQASFVAQQTLAGFTRGKADKVLAEGAKAYVYELDMLSKLTGKQRSVIQAEQEALQNNARYRAMLTEVDTEQAAQFQRFITALPKELQDGATDLLANAGNPVTKAGQELAVQFSQGGLDARQLFSDLRSGSKSVGKGLTEMANASKRSTESTKGLVKVIGTDSIVTRNYIGLSNLAKKAGISMDDIIASIEKDQATQKISTDNTAEAASKAHDLARKMESLLSSVESVMAANNYVADSMIGLGKLINKLSGKSTPALPSILKGAAIGALGGSVAGPAGIVAGGVAGGVVGYMKAGDIEPSSTGGAAGGSSMLSSVIDAGPGFTTIMTASGEKQRREGVRNWRNNNPGNLEYGSFAKQQGAIGSDGRFAVFPNLESGKLAMENRLFGKGLYENLTIGAAISKYAPPSENDTAKYIDIVTKAIGLPASSGLNSLSSAQRQLMLGAMMKHEGFKEGKISKAANGALVQPTPGGSLVQVAEAGMPEAIIPMPNGKSIPVTIKNTGEQMEMMSRMFSNMSSKYDTMIDLLSRSNSLQNDIARNLA